MAMIHQIVLTSVSNGKKIIITYKIEEDEQAEG